MSSPRYPIRIATNEVKIVGETLGEPVFWVGRQWAVTADGLEKRDGTFVIDANRLWDSTDQVQQKAGIDLHDFKTALAWARNHYSHLRKSKTSRGHL